MQQGHPAPANATIGEKTQGQVDTTEAAAVPEFEEGGYGWVVVVCVALVNMHTWGLNSSFAVFLAYYLNSGQFDGTSPIVFAFVGGIAFCLALMTAPLVTISVRHLGSRYTLGLGVIIQTSALVGASFGTEIWHLVLTQGIAFGLGVGLSFNSTVSVVSQWFDKRRSFANSLTTCGSGFGGLIYSLATNAAISSVGLPWAFRILAVLTFVVNGTCCILMRDRNKAVGTVLSAFRWELLRKKEYLLFLSWGFFSLIGYTIIIFSLADYGQSVGLTASQASLAAAIMNLGQGVGHPIIGLSNDRWGRFNVAGLSTLLAGLTTLFIWVFAGKHFAGLIVYALFGALAGCIWPTVAAVGAEVVGLPLLPSALSIFWVFLSMPALFAQPIALAIKGSGANGYLGVQLLAGLAYIVAFAFLWLLRAFKFCQRDVRETSSDTEFEDGGAEVGEKAAKGGKLVGGLFSMKYRL
ncbi:major facilitator superfamily domain-containing protein [Plectosphaerella cucumerina]|uniref:Major facilitator superfamily domain-containing protein n=1 Tax=Plectosphaerella cucumerina TaxID=40658 RepID=A0A8K0WZ01_9PEZI|nr:major facilitator superfamily domain-containing protein [Plectosphaerella cucumerina]